MDSLARLQTIFRDVLADPELVITPGTTPADCEEWDSVAMVRLLLAIEAEFGVRFTTSQLVGIQSVRDILARLPAA